MLAGLVLGAAMMQWWRGPNRSSSTITRVSIALPSEQAMEFDVPFALSRDGSRIAYHGIGSVGRGSAS